ncbi:RNA-directed DNA polymerase, eukaryota [Tanacetum coccineum]|uniref:RNA-directed DNA polymerase, eukaryota n=1 Tax=Tanacetum coccineum TaxID=301880 RepID=A0ABQ5F0F9_9ASTR
MVGIHRGDCALMKRYDIKTDYSFSFVGKVQKRTFGSMGWGIGSCFASYFKLQILSSLMKELRGLIDRDGYLHSRRVCIKTTLVENIYESFKVIIQGKTFWIRAKEVSSWMPDFEEDFDLKICKISGGGMERDELSEGTWAPNGKKLIIIFVYAPQELREKKMLWDYLILVLKSWNDDVIIMGDFNKVRTQDERHGSIFNAHGADAFNLFISSARLDDVLISLWIIVFIVDFGLPRIEIEPTRQHNEVFGNLRLPLGDFKKAGWLTLLKSAPPRFVARYTYVSYFKCPARFSSQYEDQFDVIFFFGIVLTEQKQYGFKVIQVLASKKRKGTDLMDSCTESYGQRGRHSGSGRQMGGDKHFHNLVHFLESSMSRRLKATIYSVGRLWRELLFSDSIDRDGDGLLEVLWSSLHSRFWFGYLLEA